MLQIEGLRKSYGKLRVLEGVDLQVTPGEVCGLIGPNGAGKTTPVSIVTGLRDADAGSVRVAGLDAASNRKAIRGIVGCAPQELGLYMARMKLLEAVNKIAADGCAARWRRWWPGTGSHGRSWSSTAVRPSWTAGSRRDPVFGR